MLFKKKPIESIEELELELKKTYDRTNPDIIHDYLAAEQAEIGGRSHTVTGCDDCPFVRSIRIDNEREHAFCLWDGSKSDISAFIGPGAVSCPSECPLRAANITVRINGN